MAEPDITVSEPVITVLPLFVKGPVIFTDPDSIVEPVTSKVPTVFDVPVTNSVPITDNELESTVEPETCKVLVPKVATRIFSTEIATDPLATWFIPLGFSPVYLIFY
jgi:hypothetical protein